MKPIEWLERNAPGFKALSEPEREAISNFSLLWSLFEARALNTRGSSNGILTLTHKWSSQGLIDMQYFSPSLQYFQQHYYSNSVATQHLESLFLRANDYPELVNAVLKSENTNPADCVAALLIIVYRLRNNLFHGAKWAYGIKGQLDNFSNANSILMSALSIENLR